VISKLKVGNQGHPHPLESVKWIEKSSSKISSWKIKWKVVWIELELISFAKLKGEGVKRWWGISALTDMFPVAKSVHTELSRRSSPHLPTYPVFSCLSEKHLSYSTDMLRGVCQGDVITEKDKGKGQQTKTLKEKHWAIVTEVKKETQKEGERVTSSVVGGESGWLTGG